MENIFKTAIASVITIVTYFFGQPDMWLVALTALIITDYITGIAKAYILSQLSSKEGFKGILKKLMYFAIVAVAVIVDHTAGAGGMLRVMVIGFLTANEALSILENCAAADLPVPKSLITLLHKLKDAGDQELENKK